MENSKTRTGRPFPRAGSRKMRNTKTSAAVRTTPAHIGIDGKMRHIPMAEPSSSAKSVDMIAISVITYKGYRTRNRISFVCFGLSCKRRQKHTFERLGLIHFSVITVASINGSRHILIMLQRPDQFSLAVFTVGEVNLGRVAFLLSLTGIGAA